MQRMFLFVCLFVWKSESGVGSNHVVENGKGFEFDRQERVFFGFVRVGSNMVCLFDDLDNKKRRQR